MAIKTDKLVVEPLVDTDPLLHVVGTEVGDTTANITTLYGPWYSGESMPDAARWNYAGMVKIDINGYAAWIPVFRKIT